MERLVRLVVSLKTFVIAPVGSTPTPGHLRHGVQGNSTEFQWCCSPCWFGLYGRQDMKDVIRYANTTLRTLSLFLHFVLLLSLSLSLSESLDYGELSHLAHLGYQMIGCCVSCFGSWFVSSSPL